MNNVDMMVGLLTGQNIEVWDLWSTGELTPSQDTDLDGSNDITLISSALISNKGFNATFSRPLDTKDQYDKVLTPGMTLTIIWATYDSEAFEQHNNNGDGTLTLGRTSQDSSLTTSSSSGGGSTYEEHGITMTTLWGILAPLALICSRYFRYTFWWFWVHISLGLTVIIGTIVSVLLVYSDNKSIYDEFKDDERTHSRLGLTILVLVITLGGLGAISAYDMWKRRTIYRISVERSAHSFVGGCLIIAGFYNCFVGWDLNGSSSGENYIIISVAVLVFAIVLFEIRQQIANNFPYSFLDFRKRKLKEMSHIEVLEIVLKDKKKYAFYEKYVIDLAGFVNLHPGGAFVLKDAYKEDVGKYLIGCSSHGYNFLPYVHSLKALDMARRLAIAQIKFPTDFVRFTDNSKGEFRNVNWTLVSKNEIANHLYFFQFTSQEMQILKENYPIHAIGKHFRLDAELEHNKASRYYSIILVNLDVWKQQFADRNQREISMSHGAKSAELEPLKDNSLNLIIKIYPKGKLTQYLYNFPVGKSLSLEGPFGPGLALTEEFRGPCAAFTAGTGLIPFLDLVYRMWEWSTHVEPRQDLSLFLYVSFRSIKDAFAIDLLKACAISMQNLKIHIRIDDSPDNQGKINHAILLDVDIGSMERVWICGPSGFNRMVCDMILEEKVPREKILIL